MQSETKTCQNCKQNFVIEPEDFEFYEKIKVPPPTFCPECRLQRKMARRNERTLYKRQCDLCKSDTISMYPAKSEFTVYCNACWWSDKWDPLNYSLSFNAERPFFEQFYELSKKVPRLALYQKNAINSQYTNHCDHPKNCYWTFDTGFGEEIMYSKWIVKARDLLDSYGTFESELSYEIQDCERCYRSVYLYYSNDSLDSAFLYNCVGTQHSFLSSNLRNKSYYFENRQMREEEYRKRIADLGSYKNFKSTRSRFKNQILPTTLRKYAVAHKVVNSTGDNLYECKNLKYSFHVYESEDGAFCVDSANLKDCYDTYEAAFNCERQYETHACNRVSYSKFSSISYDNHHIEYSEMCHGSSNLFGCIGVRNKQYCILNKQYTKEEYDAVTAKIVERMSDVPYRGDNGRVYKYGEFFPMEISPFAYNETIAQEYFPLSKEEILEKSYVWTEPESKQYNITVQPEDLPDHIKDVRDSILKETIGCQHENKCQEQCSTAFRIIPQELEFYRKMNLPIPRLCPNCRHYQRLKQRNPLKLWHRKCQCAGSKSENAKYQNTAAHFHKTDHCPNEFETSYAPDCPEIVYCEQCYQAEVV